MRLPHVEAHLRRLCTALAARLLLYAGSPAGGASCHAYMRFRYSARVGMRSGCNNLLDLPFPALQRCHNSSAIPCLTAISSCEMLDVMRHNTLSGAVRCGRTHSNICLPDPAKTSHSCSLPQIMSGSPYSSLTVMLGAPRDNSQGELLFLSSSASAVGQWVRGVTLLRACLCEAIQCLMLAQRLNTAGLIGVRSAQAQLTDWRPKLTRSLKIEASSWSTLIDQRSLRCSANEKKGMWGGFEA